MYEMKRVIYMVVKIIQDYSLTVTAALLVMMTSCPGEMRAQFNENV
jgi:hypothetical protein